MVKLKKIICDGVHGRIAGEWNVSGPTCIVGPNMAGKSTLLGLPLAIMLSDIERYGTPPTPASATLEFEQDGRARRYGVTYGPGETTAWYVDGRVAAARASKSDRAAVIGPAAAWDVSAFLRSSARERTSWLAANAGAEEWSVADVCGAVDIAFDTHVAEARAEHEKAAERSQKRGEAVAPFVPPLGGAWRAFAASCKIEIANGAAPETGAKWIERVTAAVKDAATNAQRRKLDDERGAEDDAKKLAEAEASAPAGTAARWTAEADEAVREATRLAAQVEDADRSVRAYKAIDGKILSVSEAEAKARAEMDALLLADAPDIQALTVAAESAEHALTEARKQHDDTESRARAMKGKADAERDRYRVASARANKAVAERDAAGAFAPLIDSVRGLLSAWELEPDVGELADAAPSVAEAISELRANLKAAPAIPSQLEIERAQEDLRIVLDAGAKLAEDERSAQRRYEAARTEFDSARTKSASAARALADAKSQAGASEKRLVELRQRVSELTAERERLVLERSEVQPPQDVASLREQIAQLEAKTRTARANALRIGGLSTMQTALDKRRSQARESEAQAKALRALVEIIAQARVALLEVSRDPIAEVATRIVQRVLGASIKVEGGDVRIVRGDTVYSVDTASDAERVIVLMAFALAVRLRLPGWRPVFVDRLDAIEAPLRNRLAEVLVEFYHRGEIDNVVIALHGDASVAPPNYNVIELPGA
jgi:hypothetical protein